MRAAVIQTTGSPDVIEIMDLPRPRPAPNEVLIETCYASVNPIDGYLRSGVVRQPLPQPYIVGCDMAGRVADVGAEVKRWRKGDRVWVPLAGFGGEQGVTAEWIAVRESQAFEVPDNVELKQAAACGLVGMTAHIGLFSRAGLQRGETVFIRGGSGAVGSMVIQMAIARGARVIATARSPAKVAACLKWGATSAFEYHDQDLAKALLAQAPEGVDVFWDTTRQPDLDAATKVLREGGRILLMAGREAVAAIPVGPFYAKELRMQGLLVFRASKAEREAASETMRELWSAGTLRAPIAAEYPLDAIRDAHRDQESPPPEAVDASSHESTLGKRVVILNPDD